MQNETCDVTVKLKNPLPYELQVFDMRLLTNGVVFESIPETTLLPALSSSTITLRGTPIEHGSRNTRLQYAYIGRQIQLPLKAYES